MFKIVHLKENKYGKNLFNYNKKLKNTVLKKCFSILTVFKEKNHCISAMGVYLIRQISLN